MPSLNKLERTFGRFAIPGLTRFLVAGQVFVVLSTMLGLLNPGYLALVPQLVLAGQWWRLGTFLLQPPAVSPGLLGIVFLVFAWWIFYFMGSALEDYWGAFRYNVFLLTAYVLTVGLSFLQPGWLVSNQYIAGSVFLAFAYLNPNFELIIFFILPVKIRWLAVLTWALYVLRLVTGSWAERLQIIAASVTFLLFFGRDAWLSAGLRRRARAGASARAAQGSEPRHTCRICGKTDRTNPELDFRYCSKCADGSCYCPEHIFNHEHVLSEDQAHKSG